MSSKVTSPRFYGCLFWVPFLFMLALALMALANVGYPARWPWWVFSIIGFGPTILWAAYQFTLGMLQTVVPPKDLNGNYKVYFDRFDNPKTLWVWSREAREFRRWFKDLQREEAAKRKA